MKDFAKSIVTNTKAEVEKVGNSAKVGNAEVFKDGDVWVVLYAEGTKSKEFKTEAEAKKFAAQVGNSVPDDMINGPAAAEIRETAGRVYKKEMREDDLARATAFELAKKYKNFQKSSTFMETIKDVLKKFKTGNSKVGNKDPRIASLKEKLKKNKTDTGALKDVLSLAESVIKDLQARKEKLLNEVHSIEEDLIGWQDVKTEAKWNL